LAVKAEPLTQSRQDKTRQDNNYFWLYALDRSLELQAGLNREELLDAIADHVTAQARLVGTYQR
jgi:phosphatidylethanolamine-binding protein (PEBP) family uncharacterized protein